MTLLVLEILGDSDAQVAEATHTFVSDLSFSKATLRAVALHAPGSQLTQDWTKAETGDALATTRTVHAPLYVDIDNLINDDAGVQFYSSKDDDIELRTLIPIGTGHSSYTTQTLDLPIATSSFDIRAGQTITVRMFYRPVQVTAAYGQTTLEYGKIQPMVAGTWSQDCRCVLYIDLE